MLLSKAELAKEFRVSLPTITAWLHRGLPHVTRGGKGRSWQFELADAIAWRIEDVIQQRIDTGDEGLLDLQTERAKLAKAQRQKLEREIATLDGKLIPAEDVERVWSGMIGAFRARMLALPSRLAPVVAAEVEPGSCFAALQAGIHEALTELSQYDPD